MIIRDDREQAGQVDIVPDEIIVKISPDATQEEIEQARDSLGATLVEATATLGLERWSLPEDPSDKGFDLGSGFDLGKALDRQAPGGAIEYMQANRIYSVSQTVPNDPDFGLLWGLDNQGQDGGVADADIDAPEAWDQETGSGTVVAVIDTGIELPHPDLDDNIWSNPGEIAGNGVDDDGNGYVDDISGYDFVNEDADPTDDYFHGTHVAGTIAAEGDNGVGVTGVAWDARLMVVKAFDSAGFGNEFDIIQAIEYAALEGADISNNSWSGYDFSQGVHDAVRLAGEQGQLFVAAASNETSDNDSFPAYPASFDLDNIVSVAATTASDTLASFSNYGATTVDLGAPGENIYSTFTGGGYGYLSGTSMATPHVSGTAALLLSRNPDLSTGELKALLLDTVDPVADLAGRTVTGGRLNAAAALAASGPPVEITGTDEDDDLTGTAGRDIIRVLDGDDTIQGLGGSDRIFGGGGRDLAAAGAGNDTIHGGSGNDNLLGEEGDDTTFGDDGADALFGGSGDDTLDGGDGADRVLGEAGSDTVDGGGGNDLIDGGGGDDRIAGGDGSDAMNGGGDADSLSGDAGADLLAGGVGNDTLDGGDGADRLVGADPASAGSAGRGEIDGLTGGSGSDTFVLGTGEGTFYEDGDPLTTGEDDYARIEDFDDGEDRIELTGTRDDHVLDLYRAADGTLKADLIHDPGDTARGDKVGQVQRVDRGLTLDDPAFSFLGTAAAATPASAVAVMAAVMAAAEQGGDGADDPVQPAAVPLPVELFDGGGFLWDIWQDGSILDGSSDAYDGGMALSGFPFQETAETEEDGREIVIGPGSPEGSEGISVTRKIFVPGDQSWARFLEVVTNTGAVTATHAVNIVTNFGSDFETGIVGTSSGDAVFDPADQWVVSDDQDGTGDPTLLHVIRSADAPAPSSASISEDFLDFTYDLTLAPGESRIVMHFASQNPDQAAALAQGPVLASADMGALAGLSDEEISRIVNFDAFMPEPVVGTDGNDLLSGTDRRDVIDGRGGDDLIQGLGGNDRLSGGSGDDVLAGGTGNDQLDGGSGDDALGGDEGDDTLDGDEGSDDLAGGAGDDTLRGASGDDRMLGGDGDDLLEGGAGTDVANGGTGDDTIRGDGGDDRLQGAAGDDTLEGGDGGDRLVGTAAVAGTFGTGETDVMTGGPDGDVFVLGDGERVFYDDLDATTPGENDYALLTDFRSAADRIELTGTADLYRLDFFAPSGGIFSAALIHDTDEARGELVAILRDVPTSLRLDDTGFLFV
ncbi:S8 family serine peptidase (plasmid) [Skermanella mucosa]|uniref:S8 family serine peptidase n=1 Tax=Skermanella mucosa TaxID=1789672 RepID=UPI00192C4BB1|nr:S8 family serine peptidase [Skermanella mucosa]UEM25318.1 S8 family serine peptidase [Skermanella mucosa]